MDAANPLHVEPIGAFSVNQLQKFPIHLSSKYKPSDLVVTISNPVIGLIDKQLEWSQSASGASNKCLVSFKAPSVGLYTIHVELAHQPQYSSQFQTKAYDHTKVFIIGSTGSCLVGQSYEFNVDASEAGEGQLEIAVNEGEIPNQVQVLDNGKCIVNFVPEGCVPHVVDIKFNGIDVQGCPFVVEVRDREAKENVKPPNNQQKQQVPSSTILEKPTLTIEERVLINQTAFFSINNVQLEKISKNDIVVVDPKNQQVSYKITGYESEYGGTCYKFEFPTTIVGDYSVELDTNSKLVNSLPASIVEQFPLSFKVFDHKQVIVSDVVDGVIGHPVFFFIDASQAGSGNLEIRVSSKTRNVPNYPQSEANAKIRVSFIPTEAVEHSIDVKFNGMPVLNNPFLVMVAQFPRARIPVSSQDLLKYVAIDETTSFYIDYIGTKDANKMSAVAEQLNDKSCQVHVLTPDFIYTKIDDVHLRTSDKNDKQKSFMINFKPNQIGPHKLFITVNNELLPGSPLISNAYDINQVKVLFEDTKLGSTSAKPVGQINQPVTFTVDASKAGEGTLALAVVSGQSKSPVQTDVKVSQKGHGLYNLTFVPIEFALHSIDMSFNDRNVPGFPLMVDMMDANGRLYTELQKQQSAKQPTNNNSTPTASNKSDSERSESSVDAAKKQTVQDFAQSNSTTNRKQAKPASKSNGKSQLSTTSRKSLAFGLVNVSNVVYLETGVLEDGENQVSLIGPNNDELPFKIDQGSPQPGESKKYYIEYRPKSIGTHTINVSGKGNVLRQYFVEICNPSLIRVSDLSPDDTLIAGLPKVFYINSNESGKIQLDSITILGPKRADNKIRDGDQTILGRIKSISSSSSSSTNGQSYTPVECSTKYINDYKQEVSFIPPQPGSYSIDIRCLGQSINQFPFEFKVKSAVSKKQQPDPISSSNYQTARNKGKNHNTPVYNDDDVLLKSIVVHGISLKSTPVNSTGAFIIETNRLAQAHDFDVLITDPLNNLVDVQCYLQQDGNLLAEWTPRKVGLHKIEVLYKDKQVPDSPFRTESFDPSAVVVENIKNTLYLINDKIELKVDRKQAGRAELDVAITSSAGSSLPIDVKPLENGELGEIISFVASQAGKFKMSITFGGYEVPKSPITFTVKSAPEVKPVVPVEQNGNSNGKQQPMTMSRQDLTNLAQEDCNPSKVICTGEGLKGGILGDELKVFIDTRRAGSSELTAVCMGPQKVAFCELLDRGDGTFILYIRPQEAGRQFLTIKYGGMHIPKSPFLIKVSGKPDPSKVRVYGPGVEHGVLSLYQSRFVCDTRGAGAGQLTVRIRGPKGAFKMETQRESQRDRTILCKYDPTEPGDYRIEIKWSGCHVPGSPFSVMIFDTQEELNRFLFILNDKSF